MKYFIFLCFTSITISSFAQIAGKKSKEAITILDSIDINPGDTIFLGRGSGTRGTSNIYTLHQMGFLAPERYP